MTWTTLAGGMLWLLSGAALAGPSAFVGEPAAKRWGDAESAAALSPRLDALVLRRERIRSEQDQAKKEHKEHLSKIKEIDRLLEEAKAGNLLATKGEIRGWAKEREMLDQEKIPAVRRRLGAGEEESLAADQVVEESLDGIRQIGRGALPALKEAIDEPRRWSPQTISLLRGLKSELEKPEGGKRQGGT